MAAPVQLSVLLAASALWVTGAQAAMLNGQIQARLVIMASCQVSSGAGAADENRLDHLGTLDVNQVQQFSTQALVALRGDVVLAARRKGRQRDVLIVIALVPGLSTWVL